MKPILFNTEMVRAILDGRKTCTRRLPSKHSREAYSTYSYWALAQKKMSGKEFYEKYPPYQPGDILYVRETWTRLECWNCEGDKKGNCSKEPQKSVLDKTCGCYMYRATDEIWGDTVWHPSIHMPKEAARIWLKVTDVRCERLQDMTISDIRNEGLSSMAVHTGDMEIALEEWKILWDSTIKKADLDRYGWQANPWVWVISFERCEKPEMV